MVSLSPQLYVEHMTRANIPECFLSPRMTGRLFCKFFLHWSLLSVALPR